MSGKNPSSAPAARRARAVESFKSAAETIGKIEHGSTVFAITRGQFSMIDAILHTLDELGPSEISVWTWTVADYEIEALTSLRRDGRITRGTLMIDPGARTKNSALIAEWKAAFGADSVRYVLNHAKIATVANGDKKVLLRGSMNLNCNPRFEQFDLSEGGRITSWCVKSSASCRFSATTALAARRMSPAALARRSRPNNWRCLEG